VTKQIDLIEYLSTLHKVSEAKLVY